MACATSRTPLLSRLRHVVGRARKRVGNPPSTASTTLWRCGPRSLEVSALVQALRQAARSLPALTSPATKRPGCGPLCSLGRAGGGWVPGVSGSVSY